MGKAKLALSRSKLSRFIFTTNDDFEKHLPAALGGPRRRQEPPRGAVSVHNCLPAGALQRNRKLRRQGFGLLSDLKTQSRKLGLRKMPSDCHIYMKFGGLIP